MTANSASHGISATVAARIAQARADLGLTQRQLANRLDVDSMAVSNWERRVYHPSVENLAALSLISGRPVAWFYTEAESAEQAA